MKQVGRLSRYVVCSWHNGKKRVVHSILGIELSKANMEKIGNSELKPGICMPCRKRCFGDVLAETALRQTMIKPLSPV
ncbi:MAG: hypothetical protein AABX38_05755 [Candidatus Micrarchaeota archaeon]